jgi:hypothetical protein
MFTVKSETHINTGNVTYDIISYPIPVAAQSKTWVFYRSLVRIAGSNPTGGMEVFLL